MKQNKERLEFTSHQIAPKEPEVVEAVIVEEPDPVPEIETDQVALEVEDLQDPGPLGDESDNVLTSHEQQLFSEDAGIDQERPDPQWAPRSPRIDSPRTGVWVFLGVLIILVLVSAGGYFWLQSSNAKSKAVRDYQGTITSLWTDRVDESKKIKAAVETVTDLKGISGLLMLLNTERESIGSEIPRLSTMAVPGQYAVNQSDLVAFMIDYKDYLATVLTVLSNSDTSAVTAKQLTDMVTAGQEAGRSAGLIRLNSDFIRQDMNSTVFEVLPQNIKRMIEDAKALAAGQEQKDIDAKKQKEQDLKDVQNVVETFMQAYIELDFLTAKALLTEQAGKKYELFTMGSDTVVDYLMVSTLEKEDYYLLVVKVTREFPDPAFVAPLSGPVGEVPLVSRTTNQEFQVIKESDAWKIRYVEFLEQV